MLLEDDCFTKVHNKTVKTYGLNGDRLNAIGCYAIHHK